MSAENPEAIAQVEAGMRELYRPDAEAVLAGLAVSDVVVVTGPWKSGKTTFLAPLVGDYLAREGRPSVMVGCPLDFEDDGEDDVASTFIEPVPLVEDGVAFLDEASREGSIGHERGLARLLRGAGYRATVPIIPHPIGADGVAEYVERWAAVSEGESATVPRVSLEPRKLPATLVEAYLGAHQADQAAAEYMLSLPEPHYLAVLTLPTMPELRSLSATVRAMHSGLLYKAPGIIPPEKLNILRERVAADLSRIVS